MAGRRADARRNYAHILAVAEKEVAAHGADASLEQIARVAGVGSATVRRHFPGRRALLEAVFSEETEVLCADARELVGHSDPRAALLEWLDALAAYVAASRGLATLLLPDGIAEHEDDGTCSPRLHAAAEPLVRRAAQAGAVAPGTTAADLVTLIVGIVLATEQHPAPATEAARLLALAVQGISPGK
ncbi:TetR/AcrR family transcriptional regulator [Streptomyces sp. NPDC048282]|uniref:TetR/AcrR family transcriptional regulator n=1 Tax=Streptomyces sp. NPDC048282 TaxID=3365528 RepID=UPI00372151BD